MFFFLLQFFSHLLSCLWTVWQFNIYKNSKTISLKAAFPMNVFSSAWVTRLPPALFGLLGSFHTKMLLEQIGEAQNFHTYNRFCLPRTNQTPWKHLSYNSCLFWSDIASNKNWPTRFFKNEDKNNPSLNLILASTPTGYFISLYYSCSFKWFFSVLSALFWIDSLNSTKVPSFLCSGRPTFFSELHPCCGSGNKLKCWNILRWFGNRRESEFMLLLPSNLWAIFLGDYIYRLVKP